MKIVGKSLVFWAAVAALCSGAVSSQAGVAQDAEVRDPRSIGDFRLDQPARPAGPTDPERPNTTTPRTTPTPTQAEPQQRPPATQPEAQTQRTTPAPAPTRAAPTPTQRAATAPQVAERTPTLKPEAAPSVIVPSDVTQPAPPTPSQDAIDAAEGTDEAVTETAATAAPTIAPNATEPETGPDWGVIAPYAVGAGLLLALFWFTQRRRKVQAGATANTVPVEPLSSRTPAPQPAVVPAPAPPAPKPRPSGTVGIPIAKAPPPPAPPPAPKPAPSLAERGFITTRANQPDAPSPRPSGTVGIPASRIAAAPPPAPEPPAPEPVVQLTEGTRLIAGLTAEELIRDADELRLRFALTIANLGTMEARDVALRTVMITAAPDSDRKVAGWLANPTGEVATTIDTINSGMQTQVTVNIRLSADQIRPVRHGGEAVFVPMLAIALDYIGADGLDRTGDAFIIGQTGPKAANGIAAPVLPLPHEGALPRRWTDLAQRPAGLGALAKV